MNAVPHKATILPPNTNLFTVAEAAWAAGTKDTFVNQEVDKKVVLVLSGSKRLFAEWDLLYLRAVRKVGPSLKLELRRHIYQTVRHACQQKSFHRVKFDAFELRMPALQSVIDPRVAKIKAARDAVEIRADIKGGEPVVRGTRISVHILAKMIHAGTTFTEVAEEYELSPLQVELALLYDRLHPRKGRPAKPHNDLGLADFGTLDRGDFEHLGEFKRRDLSRSG